MSSTSGFCLIASTALVMGCGGSGASVRPDADGKDASADRAGADATAGQDAATAADTAVAGPGCDTTGSSSVYHVGPGQTFTKIGDVPWYSLTAGSTVCIHYRTEPYHEKLLVSGRGTPDAWIRVLGVPGPNGELPVISGDNATTGTNMHYRWQQPDLVQWDGVIQIAVGDGDGAPLPGYIEIAQLHVQDGYSTYSFTAENGTRLAYDSFAACIYARSAQHIVIRDNVLSNCGQGFYNWIGDGSSDSWWAGLEVDTVIRGNQFQGNGHVDSYTEHQLYAESDGVVIENNRFGPQRPGALGSQIKDRSAGTVVRYNIIEQSAAGWDLDLVEPQESWPALGSRASYKQAFVYGNLIVARNAQEPNFVHWNEDHQAGQGRATLTGGKLFFYDNTIVVTANASSMASFSVFNVTYGGYDCPPVSHLPGVIDVRNNLFAVLPVTSGAQIPTLQFGYCGLENFSFGNNWVSPGWIAHGDTVSGAANVYSPAANDPGFVAMASDDFHLSATSDALGRGGALAPEVTSNALGLDLTPTSQTVAPAGLEPRAQSGSGSDLGALER